MTGERAITKEVLDRLRRSGFNPTVQSTGTTDSTGDFQLADLAITKASAAARLLDASIKMHLRGDYVLATHLVMSSALRLATDLQRKKNGSDFLLQSTSVALFTLGHDYINDSLPDFATNDPDTLEIARTVAGEIESGRVTTASDIEINISAKQMGALWKPIVKHYNFLKHADIDAGSIIVETEIDNDKTIQYLIVAYGQLFPNDKRDSMLCYHFFSTWKSSGTKYDWMASLFERTTDMDEGELREYLVDICDGDIPL